MKVVVIGGGPAGMMSAIFSAKNGNDVTLIEQNEKLGKKLYITGKGRCNVTNDSSVDDFLSCVVSNPKFLSSSLHEFSPEDVMNFFESSGLKLKVERGNRVFPSSDKSSDVIKCFENLLNNLGVCIVLNEKVTSLSVSNGKIVGVKTVKKVYDCDKAVVCTGGISYASTGSTGDGYIFAKSVGHTVIEPVQSLTGFNLVGEFYKDLQGLTLKNVLLTAKYNGKVISKEFGELLFTHYGISGPIVLSTSCFVNRCDFKELELYLDLKPALDDKQLDDRILRDFAKYSNKALKNSLDDLLPKSMISYVIEVSGVDKDKKNSVITAEERKSIVGALKRIKLKIASLRDFTEAVVTAGGVNVKEVNPKTMESKIIKGLYFAGEVLDVDALTGGYNIQIALSTGHSAGVN